MLEWVVFSNGSVNFDQKVLAAASVRAVRDGLGIPREDADDRDGYQDNRWSELNGVVGSSRSARRH